MSARVRRKRASAGDLYKSCKAGGDCIPDVQNKIEGTTWADRLLQWFGSIIYLGNLGIGTGKGTGGSFGYRPLDSGTGGRAPNVPVRPAVPTEIVPEVIPGLVLPEGPSIVPLTDLVVDTGVVIDTTTFGADVPTDVNILFENINPTYDVTTIAGHPTIISSTDEAAAVLEIGAIDTQTTRVSLDTGHIDDVNPHNVYNIFVDPLATGSSIGGYEEIELLPLHREEFEIEEPKTSTPETLLNRVFNNARRYYGRSVQQMPTRNPAFLTQPSRLVQFEYENPAFTPADLTLRFQQDVAEVAAAPEPDFADVHVLHRQALSETPEGTVRASRLGTKGYIRTRAGTLVGQDVHYYYDFSTIENAESFELAPLDDFSGNQALQNETSFVYPDNELLDELVESFNDSHLVLQTEDNNEAVTVPMFATGSPKVFVLDIGFGNRTAAPKYVLHVGTDVARVISPATSNIFSEDYYLHPSLHRKRKRRKPLFF